MVKEETTFYRFNSEIKSFLGKLKNKPIQAEPSKYLKDRGFTKDKLIRLLIKKGIIDRNEKILTPDKDGVKNVKYTVKYKIHVSTEDNNVSGKTTDVTSQCFDDKIEKIYKSFFGEPSKVLKEEMDMFSCPNIVGVVSGRGGGVGSKMCDRWAEYVNNSKDKKRTVFKDEDDMKKRILKTEKKKVNECDCGSCGADIAGATNTECSGQFIQPFGGVQRRDILATKQKKDKNYIDPTKILGKTINAESQKRKVVFTESQMRYIMEAQEVDLDEATTCGGVGAETSRGDVGYDAPGFTSKKNDKFWKDSLKHNNDGKGISMERLDEGFGNKLRNIGAAAAIGAASLFGGQSIANAQNTNNCGYTYDYSDCRTAKDSAMVRNIVDRKCQMKKFNKDELMKLFPNAYKDRNGNPELWKKNKNAYETTIEGKVSLVGVVAASRGQNPWEAVLNSYLSNTNNDNDTFSLNDFDI